MYEYREIVCEPVEAFLVLREVDLESHSGREGFPPPDEFADELLEASGFHLRCRRKTICGVNVLLLWPGSQSDPGIGGLRKLVAAVAGFGLPFYVGYFSGGDGSCDPVRINVRIVDPGDMYGMERIDAENADLLAESILVSMSGVSISLNMAGERVDRMLREDLGEIVTHQGVMRFLYASRPPGMSGDHLVTAFGLSRDTADSVVARYLEYRLDSGSGHLLRESGPLSEAGVEPCC